MAMFRAALPEELDEVVGLLEEAGTWLWERGIRQWEPGSHLVQRPRLARDIERGCLYVARHSGPEESLAGCVIVDADPNPIWSDRPGEARYVYKLAVARAFSGRGLGREILRDCESLTARSGVGLVRLDCWAGNAPLRAYYTAAGYEMCGEAEEHGTLVARFEKRVSSALESEGSGA